MKKNLAFFKGLTTNFIIIVVIILLSSCYLYSTTRTSTGTGNWNNSGTWTPSGIPASSDDLIILSGHTITGNIATTCSSLTFSGTSTSTATLSVNSGVVITVTNAVNLNSATGNYSTCSITGSGALYCNSVNVGNLSNIGSFYIIEMISDISSFVIANNLNISSNYYAAGNFFNNAKFTVESGIVTVNGTIQPQTFNSTSSIATIELGSFGPTLVLSGPTPFGSTGNSGIFTTTLNGTDATVVYDYAGAQTARAATYTNMTLAGSGNKTLTGTTVNGKLSMQGTATATATTPTYGLAASLEYKGSASQTTGIEFPANWSGSGGIQIENASGVTLNAAKNIGSNPFTIGNIISNSVFRDGGYQLSGTGTLNLVSGTFEIGSTINATTFPAFTTKNISDGTTVSYLASIAQNIASISNYSNLTFQNSTKTASGNIGFDHGVLTNSTVLDMGTNILSANTGATFSNSGGTIKFNGNTNGISVSTGTVEYSKKSGGQTVASGTYFNVMLDNNSATNTAAGNLTINGTLTTTAGGTLDMQTYLFDGNPAIVNQGTIRTSNITSTPMPSGKNWGGTIEYYATTQGVSAGTYNNLLTSVAGTKTASGNITATFLDNGGSGDVAAVLDMAGYTLSVTSINNNGATVKFNGISNGIVIGSGIVEYYGTSQNVASGTYSTLIISAAGTKTASGNISASTLDNGGSSDNAAILEMAGYTLGVTNIQNTNATIKFSGASNGIAVSTGTIEYSNTSGNQTAGAGTYYSVVFDNSGGTDNTGGNIQATSVTTTSGGVLDLGTNTLTGTLSTITNNGTIYTTNTTSGPLGSGKTWGGSGTVEYGAPGGGQTIVSGTYNCNLKLDNSSGINSAGGTVTLNGKFTTTGGGTLNLGTVLMNGNPGQITHNGILRTAYAGSIAIPDGETWSGAGTVIYEGSSAQVISGGTFYNVSLNNPVGGTLYNNITIEGTFTLTQGTVTLNSKIFAYGNSSSLLYNGSSAQNAGSEMPFTNPPFNLTISNSSSSGVSYSLDSRTIGGDFTLNSGSKFTVNEGAALFVEGNTTNSSTPASLLIKSSASGTGCFCINSTSDVQAKVQRYAKGKISLPTNPPFPYHYISSPISDATFDQIYQTGEYNIYWYDETWVNGDLDKGWSRMSSGYGNLIPGQGYTIVSNYSERPTFDFEGFLNKPNINKKVTWTLTPNSGSTLWKSGMDPQGWNLLGNPFACALSVATFLTDNANKFDNYFSWGAAVYSWDDIDGGIDRWGDYNTCNLTGGTAATNNTSNIPNGKIAVGQGFFVKVKSGVTSVNFNAGQRVANSAPQFFIADPTAISRYWISLNREDGGYNQALVGFLAYATDGFDLFYDARKLKGNPEFSFYSILNGDDYAIQGLPLIINSKEIPLGFDITERSTLTIMEDSVENFPGDVSVFLEDKLMNIFINLTERKQYTFTSNEGTNKERFVLHFTRNSSSVWKNDIDKNDGLYLQGDKIVIGGNLRTDYPVIITDMAGKIVLSVMLECPKREIVVNGLQGIFLISIITDHGKITKKVYFP